MTGVLTTPSSSPALPGKIGAARQAYDVGRELLNWWRARTRWSVSVSSADRLYDAAHHWFTDARTLSAPPRALQARLRYGDGQADPMLVSDPAPQIANVSECGEPDDVSLGLSTAAASELFKQHADDPAAAAALLRRDERPAA